MRFTIVGAGALGSILGAHLGEAGHAVRLVARGRRAEMLAADGLRVHGLREIERPCEVAAALEPGLDEGVVIYAVKTYHMAAALDGVDGLAPHAVFSVANGVLKNEQLGRVFGPDRVLGCMANFSGELLDDGSVVFTRNVCLHLGGARALAADVAATIDAAGIVTACEPDIESVEWSKFVGWVALCALALIARTTTARYLANERLAALGARVIREAAALARARRVTLADVSPMPVASIAVLPFEEAVARVVAVGRELAAQAPGHRMSSLQDLEAGRRLEVHETLGYAVAEAARLGVDAPALAMCYDIAAALDDLQGS